MQSSTFSVPFVFDANTNQLSSCNQVPDYISCLNEEQRLAVETTEGPLLVLAGAGTGKTRVLVSRIAHIIATTKAKPHEILVTTFTNKAAREMKERVKDTTGPVANSLSWIGTFHALSARILRNHTSYVGLQPDFAILSAEEQVHLLKKLIESANLDEKRWPAKLLASIINEWKNKGLDEHSISNLEAQHYLFGGKAKQLYAAYQARLSEHNAVDYGDLLSLVVRIWKQDPNILAEYQSKFRYILVDEYQDTNIVQYLWLKLLAIKSKNIACVGDDDQSIYGWRGAEVTNILRFEQNFPGAKVILLKRNYRSTSNILNSASYLISHNKNRLPKDLFSDRVSSEDDEKVSVCCATSSKEEARSIGTLIELLRQKGQPYSQVAILVRTSSQMKEFEDRFISIGIPYRILGGPKFYDRAEIKDALAYFRCTVRPYDNLSFERILGTPKRGLGKATLQKMHALAKQEGYSTMEAAEAIAISSMVYPKTRASLLELINKLKKWHSLACNTPVAELSSIILDESGYIDMLKRESTPESEIRLDNLKELVRSAADYDSLSNFLESTALITGNESNPSNEDSVNIMTIHAAKGLEFDTVFLPGWEEGLFPHQRALNDKQSGLEEERRLAYVGLTRARKTAMIWFTSSRRVQGYWQASTPSRFLGELSQAHASFAAISPIQTEISHTNVYTQMHKNNLLKPGRVDSHIMSREGSPDTNNDLKVGTRVFSKTFGYGTTIKAAGHNNMKILFDTAGYKTIRNSYIEPV